MHLYMAAFVSADGSDIEPLGVYFDIAQSMAAVRDFSVQQHVAEHTAEPLEAQARAENMRWRHHGPKPEEGRWLELWLARDDFLNCFLVWRCEGGVRPWATEEPVADLVRNG